MAKLDFNPQAYQFEQGLKAIGLMLVAARQALESQQAEARREIAEYRNHVDSGGEPIGEWDGAQRLWDHEDDLRLELLALADALVELNRAATIAIYHHWERHVPNSKNQKFRKHKNLVTDLGQAGIEVHQDIDALRFSANFLKHGNQHWIEKLREGFSKQFPMLALVESSSPVCWGTLNLSEQHVNWFLQIAKASKRPILGTL